MTKSLRKLLAFLPCKLPQGIQEFESWSNDILDLYDMPNNDSTKFALAVAVMHLDATSAYKPKHYFGKILLKGAATQVVHAVMQDLKEKQAAKAKAEQEAAAAKAAEEAANVENKQD